MKAMTFTVIALSLAASLPAAANGRHDHNEHITFANVVDVQPVYETVSYKEPYQECHYEYHSAANKRSKTGVIIGSLIGGAIGHELGHNKSNKRVGAVAGAILGGSIASDLERGKHKGHTYKQQVCNTSHHVRYKEEINGYNVAYKYKGRTYYTRMPYDPGERIRVAVNIRPLHN